MNIAVKVFIADKLTRSSRIGNRNEKPSLQCRMDNPISARFPRFASRRWTLIWLP